MIFKFNTIRLILLVFSTFCTVVSCTNISIANNDTKKQDNILQVASNFDLSELDYEELLYFSKICLLTACIVDDGLKQNKFLSDGGCPSRLKFCSSIESNPTLYDTTIELVIRADNFFHLGTGYIAVDHFRKVVMLVFRGSATRYDWMQDLSIFPTKYKPYSYDEYEKLVNRGEIPPCGNCKIHYGFNNFLKSLHPRYLHKIGKVFKKYPDYQIVITGHSLGAAVALIAGIEFKLRGFQPIILTYGQPKMFNNDMVEWVDKLLKTDQIDYILKHKFGAYSNLNDNHTQIESGDKKDTIFSLGKGYFRITNERDYVPRLPPYYYKHAGLEVVITKPDLPQELEDLRYIGRSKDKDEKYEDEILGIKEDKDEGDEKEGSRRKNLLDLHPSIQERFHVKEHRSYFVEINECDYI
ncbi:putative lipase SCDLUD_000063 [Saccharomycodes ludwigii]|uniref:putative lipase n=1 Tax=Saccharomycodes ludwigii TaxID=36035 RepID=UPI001E8BDDB4|nr:hypothetical protein SCDLUD_000063 [Saccharomycodes ludwigii]KAH3902486.1 hypothetical protein SCDLUD_000063 [Saccharomycodes ludwigii]